MNYDYPGEPEYNKEAKDAAIGDIITDIKLLQYWRNFNVRIPAPFEPSAFMNCLDRVPSMDDFKVFTFTRRIIHITPTCAVRCWERVS
jgi:hypothetical protein